jgi:hypothetical protein
MTAAATRETFAIARGPATLAASAYGLGNGAGVPLRQVSLPSLRGTQLPFLSVMTP